MIYYILYDIHQLTANTNVILMNLLVLHTSKRRSTAETNVLFCFLSKYWLRSSVSVAAEVESEQLCNIAACE